MEYVHDFKTLKSLVLASPTMHAIYVNARHKILNRVTYNEMRLREVDITTPANLIEVRVKPGTVTELETLRLALKELWSQPSISQKPILLEVNKCKALLRLEEIVRWDYDYDRYYGPVLRAPPPDESDYWVKNGRYHAMYIAEEYLNDVLRIMSMEYRAKRLERRRRLEGSLSK